MTIKALIAAAATFAFTAATVLFGAGVAKADNCWTDCYQNGTQYQCETYCD